MLSLYDYLHIAFECVGVLVCVYVIVYAIDGDSGLIGRVLKSTLAVTALLTILLWVWSVAYTLVTKIGTLV